MPRSVGPGADSRPRLDPGQDPAPDPGQFLVPCVLLAVCPTGRSAAELSEDLFGDPEHAVTVRAEMSRLRRHLGNMLDQRPYRFPQWLEVGYELPDDPRTLLPQSTGPGLRILRGIWAAAGAMTVVRPEA